MLALPCAVAHACVHPRATVQAASLDQFDRLLFVTVSPLCVLVLLWATHTCMPFLVAHVTCRGRPIPSVRPLTSGHSIITLHRAGCAPTRQRGGCHMQEECMPRPTTIGILHGAARASWLRVQNTVWLCLVFGNNTVPWVGVRGDICMWSFFCTLPAWPPVCVHWSCRRQWTPPCQ